MDILNADNARTYLASGPSPSLLRLALEGVELAGAISHRQQPGSQQAAAYQAAARVLRTALQLDEGQATYDRLVAYRGRLLRYHDECPDGDPRKAEVELGLRRLGSRINLAERELGHLADAAAEEGIT
jgi:hypothetical protein